MMPRPRMAAPRRNSKTRRSFDYTEARPPEMPPPADQLSSEQHEPSRAEMFLRRAAEAFHSLLAHSALYGMFVLMLQLIAGALRAPHEIYVNKLVMDRFVDTHFDSGHNNFESIRRVADIYEW